MSVSDLSIWLESMLVRIFLLCRGSRVRRTDRTLCLSMDFIPCCSGHFVFTVFILFKGRVIVSYTFTPRRLIASSQEESKNTALNSLFFLYFYLF